MELETEDDRISTGDTVDNEAAGKKVEWLKPPPPPDTLSLTQETLARKKKPAFDWEAFSRLLDSVLQFCAERLDDDAHKDQFQIKVEERPRCHAPLKETYFGTQICLVWRGDDMSKEAWKKSVKCRSDDEDDDEDDYFAPFFADKAEIYSKDEAAMAAFDRRRREKKRDHQWLLREHFSADYSVRVFPKWDEWTVVLAPPFPGLKPYFFSKDERNFKWSD